MFFGDLFQGGELTTAGVGEEDVDVVSGVGAGGPPYTGARPDTRPNCMLNVNNTSGGGVPACYRDSGGAETDTAAPPTDSSFSRPSGTCPVMFYW